MVGRGLLAYCWTTKGGSIYGCLTPEESLLWDEWFPDWKRSNGHNNIDLYCFFVKKLEEYHGW